LQAANAGTGGFDVNPAIVNAQRWLRWCNDPERGQGLVEYILILALVAVIVIASLTGLGNTIVSKLYTLSGAL
jgi:pilus assembly protein Flp/PilA